MIETKSEKKDTVAKNSSIFETQWEPQSEEIAVAAYSRISVFAVVAIVFNLLSISVFLSPAFTIFSILAGICSLLAIWLIQKSDGAIFGMALAKTSFFLSVMTIVAVGVFWQYYHYTVRENAKQFAQMWLEAVKENNMPLALEMQKSHWSRYLPENPNDWWDAQIKQPRSHEILHATLKNQFLKTLILLGDKAEVSYYKTLGLVYDKTEYDLTLQYAITYPNESGEKETFFVALPLKMLHHDKDGAVSWSLSSLPNDVYREKK